MADIKPTIDQIIAHILNTGGADVPAPQRDPEEPAYADYAAHVTGERLFARETLRKLNRTPAWQRKLRMFRKELEGPEPDKLLERLAALIREWANPWGFMKWEPLLASTEGPVPEYPVAVADEHGGGVHKGWIQVPSGPLVRDGELIMKVRIVRPEFPEELRPIRLSLVAVSSGEEICDLDLPEPEQMLKVSIPVELRDERAWREISPERLPFAFVIRRAPARKLIAA
jgi:hypothetical protein